MFNSTGPAHISASANTVTRRKPLAMRRVLYDYATTVNPSMSPSDLPQLSLYTRAQCYKTFTAVIYKCS